MIILPFIPPLAEVLPPPYDTLLGPLGVTVGAILLVTVLARVLYKFVREYIDSLEEENKDLKIQLTAAIEGWQAQTAANQTLANAQEARNRDDETRHRIEDAKRSGSSRSVRE